MRHRSAYQVRGIIMALQTTTHHFLNCLVSLSSNKAFRGKNRAQLKNTLFDCILIPSRPQSTKKWTISIMKKKLKAAESKHKFHKYEFKTIHFSTQLDDWKC